MKEISKSIESQLSEIATKNNVELSFVQDQFKKGFEIEKEHSATFKEAGLEGENLLHAISNIVIDHLEEDVNSYDKEYKDKLSLESEYNSKSVDELVQIKKQLYSNIDIESPMSEHEKLLDKIIANKFSDINEKIRIKRENNSNDKQQLSKTETKPETCPNQKFIQEYLDWYKGKESDINIYFTLPQVYNNDCNADEANDVVLDLFEKINQNIDAKPYLTYLCELADKHNVNIHLEPKPRYKYFLSDVEKRKKISKEYLINYYKSFGFEVVDENKMIRKVNNKNKTIYEISKPEHAKEYGIEAKKPLYLKRLWVDEGCRNKGEGTKLLNEIEQYAKNNDCDIVFGHIPQKSEFTKNKESYLDNVTCIKQWLSERGYAVNDNTNDFHKVLNTKNETIELLSQVYQNYPNLHKGYGFITNEFILLTYNTNPNNNSNYKETINVELIKKELLKHNEKWANDFIEAYLDNDFTKPSEQVVNDFIKDTPNVPIFVANQNEIIAKINVKNEPMENEIIEQPIEALEPVELPIIEETKEYYEQNLINAVDKYILTKDKTDLKRLDIATSEYFDNEVRADFSKLKTLYEICMKADTKKAIPNFHLAYEDDKFFENLNTNLWHLIPDEFKKVSKVKKVAYLLAPKNEGLKKITASFVSHDSLMRPIMNSLHFNEKGVVATDGHKMIFVKGTPETQGEYCLHTDCFKNFITKSDGHIESNKDFKYPNWQSIIPNSYRLITITINPDSIKSYLKAVDKAKIINEVSGLTIFRYTDSSNEQQFIGFKNHFLTDCIEAMQTMGHNELDFCLSDPSRAIIIVPKGNKELINYEGTDFCLLMPMMISTDYNKMHPSNKGTIYFDLNTEEVITVGIENDVVELNPLVVKEKEIETKQQKLDNLTQKLQIELAEIEEQKAKAEAEKQAQIEAEQQAELEAQRIEQERLAEIEQQEKAEAETSTKKQDLHDRVELLQEMLSETKNKEKKEAFQDRIDLLMEMINEI